MSDIDPRILHILKTAAIEKTHCSDMDEWCGFCEVSESHHYGEVPPKFDQIEHKTDCETLLARVVLRDMGVVLGGYKVSYEIPQWRWADRELLGWQPIARYHEAFTDDELRALYPECSGEPQFQVPYFRNVAIERIEDL
jgi:hypothetical protein